MDKGSRLTPYALPFIWALLAHGCGSVHSRSGHPTSNARDPVLRRVHECTAARSPKRAGPAARWSAIVFDRWSPFFWEFSAPSLSGPGTLQRIFPHAKDQDLRGVLAAGDYRPKEGTVDVETTEALGSLKKIRASARMPKGQNAVPMALEESEKVGEPMRLDSVLFVDESGDFWTNLEWMRRCTKEALVSLD